jgi:hypothetical protein
MSEVPYVARRLGALFPGARVEVAARPPEVAVALGLARADDNGRVNMYRPAFDIVLEWGDQSLPIYNAFTPLVEAAQIAAGSADLRYTRRGDDLGLPSGAAARLRLVSHTGAQARASLGGVALDGFPVAVAPGFEFAIYPNGRVRLVDAAGTHEGHLDGWHTVG